VNAAVKAIVSVALTFLILTLIAFSFTMIKDSLPGEGRQDENYPNPLSWLTENSTIDQHPADIPFNTTQQNQKPSNPETTILPTHWLSIVIREETTNPLAARIYRDISQGLTAKEIANDLTNNLQLKTHRDQYGRSLANLSFTSTIQGVNTRIHAEAEIENLRLDVSGGNEILRARCQLTNEETVVTIPFTSIRIGNITHSQEGDLIFTCTPLHLHQIQVHEGTASYTLQGEVRNYDTQPHNYTLTTAAGVPNTVDAFTPLPSGYLFSAGNNGVLLSLLTASGLTQRQVTLNVPPASPRENTVGVTEFSVTVMVSAPPLEFGELWITLNKGPFRTVAKAPYASVETMPQITIQSFIPLEDLDYWKTATEEAVKTTIEAFPNMLKALTQETEEWAQTLTPAVAEEVKQQMEIIAQSATTQGDGRRAEAEYWQHVKTVLAASCITAADIMTAGTITGIKVAMETGSAWTGFKATFPGQLVCLIALTNDMNRPPQERARYNGRAAGIILTIIITHELAKTIKEIAPDVWSTIKQKITTLASKSKAAAQTAIQKLINTIKRSNKQNVAQDMERLIEEIDSLQATADGGIDTAKLAQVLKDTEQITEELFPNRYAKSHTWFREIVEKFGLQQGPEKALEIQQRLANIIRQAKQKLSPTWYGDYLEILNEQATASLTEAEDMISVVETALNENKIPARVLKASDGRGGYNYRLGGLAKDLLAEIFSEQGIEEGDLVRIVFDVQGCTFETCSQTGATERFTPHLGDTAAPFTNKYGIIQTIEKITQERFLEIAIERRSFPFQLLARKGEWFIEVDGKQFQIEIGKPQSSGNLVYLPAGGDGFNLRFYKDGSAGIELSRQQEPQFSTITQASYIQDKDVLRFTYRHSGERSEILSIYFGTYPPSKTFGLGATTLLEKTYDAYQIKTRVFEQIKPFLSNLEDVKLVEKITGKITREMAEELREARDLGLTSREGAVAVQVLADILEKIRSFKNHIEPRIGAGPGDILGESAGVNEAYEVVMRTNLRDIPVAINQVSQSIIQHYEELAVKGVQERVYGKIYVAISYFDAESPYYDYLIYEMVFEH